MALRHAVCLSGVILAAGTSSAAEIAANFDAPIGGGTTIGFTFPGVPGSNTAKGMSFISHADGSIDSLSITLGWTAGSPARLTVSFFTLNAQGFPDELVAARTVGTDDLAASVGGSTFGLATIDFSTGPAAYLINGQRYGWTVVSDTVGNYDGGGVPEPVFGMGFTVGSTFAEGLPLDSSDAGATWREGSYAFPFTVRTTVPAPGAGAAAAAVLAGVAVRRRRR
jgi:MYXO-CTERM domain-containing protein